MHLHTYLDEHDVRYRTSRHSIAFTAQNSLPPSTYPDGW